MNHPQRRMIVKWCIVAAAVLPLIIFDDFVAENGEWIRWLVFPLLILAPMIEPVTPEKREANRQSFNELVDEMPWLKVWAAICAAFFFGGAIYISKSQYRLEEMFGFKIVVIAFVILMLPILVATERRRFRSLGALDVEESR